MKTQNNYSNGENQTGKTLAPAKVERLLIITTGTTGGIVGLLAKRHFIEVLGYIPKSVRILNIDTDEAPQIDGATFDDSEKIKIEIGDAPAVVNNVRHIGDWYPKSMSADPIVNGAGARRPQGRLALHYDAARVFNAIKSAFDALQSPELVSDHPDIYEIPPGSSVRVIMAGSDAGGSGSAMFVDTGRYIREKLFDGNQAHQLLGFLVSGSAFADKPHTDLIAQNAYAFWKEMNYIAGADPRQVPKITLNGVTMPREDRKGVDSLLPFNKLVIVEPRNELFNYQLEDILNILGRVVFLASGFLADSALRVWKNSAALPWFGQFPIVSGVGESELVFREEEVADFAVASLIKKFINFLFAEDGTNTVSKKDVLERLQAWQLVEADQDQVIDRILDPALVSNIRKPRKFDKPTATELLATEAGQRGRMIENLRKTASRNEKEVRRAAFNDLHGHAYTAANEPGGLPALQRFLRQFKIYCDSYRKMMVNEINDFGGTAKIAGEQLEKARNQLQQASDRFWGRARGIEKAYDALADATRKHLVTEAEIIRRDSAASLYKALIEEANALEAQAKTLQSNLEMVCKHATGKLRSIFSRRRQKSPNIIAVGESLADKAISSVDPAGFLSKFSRTPSFLDLFNRNVDDLYAVIDSHLRSTPEVKSILASSLDDVLGRMADVDRKRIMSDLDRLSTPLWRWDKSLRDIAEGRKTETIFLIGCGSAQNNIFRQQDLFRYLPSKGATDPAIVGTGDSNRIVCVQFEDAVPPFALKTLGSCKSRYERSKRESVTMRDRGQTRIAFEIDGRWEDTLPDIFPSQGKEEDFQIWTLAHVPELFGLITKNSSFYYAHSKKNGRPGDDFKISLAQGRIAAFHAYVQDEALIDEHRDVIEKIAKKMGDTELADRLKEYRDNTLMDLARAAASPELKDQVEREIRALDEFINEISSI